MSRCGGPSIESPSRPGPFGPTLRQADQASLEGAAGGKEAEMSTRTRIRTSAEAPLARDGRGPGVWRWSVRATVAVAFVIGLVAGGAGWELLRPESTVPSKGGVEATAAARKTAEATLDIWRTPVTTPLVQADVAAREAALYAEDAVWVDVAAGDEATGRSEIESMFRASYFPRIQRFVDGRILLAGPAGIVVSWTWRFDSFPPTGRDTPFDVSGIYVYEMKEGVITKATVYYDRVPFGWTD